MIAKATLKSWGSSLGVVVPREIVRAGHFKEGEEVLVEIKKKHTIKEVFGHLKSWKIDSQKMKDELRREWAK